MRVDRSERRQADGLNLDEAASRPLYEVHLVRVALAVRASRHGPGDQRQRQRQRGTSYNVQPLLSARQRRVRRSTGSMTILSIATITTSITKPQAIIPVKLPASYQ